MLAFTIFALAALPQSQPVHKGDLRHAMLVDVTLGESPTARIATSVSLGRAGSRIEVHRVPLHEKGSQPLKASELHVDVPCNLLQSTEPLDSGASVTWSSQPPWAVLPVGETTVFLAHDGLHDLLYVADSAAWDELPHVADVERLTDARVRDGRIECIVLREGSFDLLTLRTDGTIEDRRALASFEGTFASACFSTTTPGLPVQPEVIVVSWKGADLVVRQIDLASGESAVRVSTFDLPRARPNVLRVAAWRAGERCRVAVGQPGDGTSSAWSRGSGRVTVLACDNDARSRILLEDFQGGESLEELRRRELTMGGDHGTSLTFLSDLDGDGTPEVAVGSPWWITSEVAILSPDRGRRIKALRTREFCKFGTTVSVDPTRRFLLVTGPTTTAPENLAQGAVARIFDLKSLNAPICRLSSRLSPR